MAFDRNSLAKFHYLLYFHHMVKPREIQKRVESTAVDAVRALLEHVPNIQIIGVRHEQQLASGHQLDARIDLAHDGSRYALLMEFKSNGAPRLPVPRSISSRATSRICIDPNTRTTPAS